MTDPKPILKADDLSKRYEDGVLALDHLNLEVRPGEVYCLLGANGAGKTTTINLFLNFIPPTTGTCFINGIDVTKDPLEAKKYVAFVSENVMLYGNFTARQNLDFFAKLGGKTAPRPRTTTTRSCAGSRSRRRPSSSGSRTSPRACGRSWASPSPSSRTPRPSCSTSRPRASTPRRPRSSWRSWPSSKNEGKAILMSTHDIFRAKEIGDRVGIMKEGRLVMERTREELQYEDLVKIYIDYMKSEPLAVCTEGGLG